MEGGNGGVDQDVLVGGVGEVERGLGDQGTPDRPEGGLGSQPGRYAGVGGGQQGLKLVVLGAQARADAGVVEHGDVGGDQRDDLAVGEQDGQVGAQQRPGRPPRLVVVLDAGVDGVQEGMNTRWCSRASLDR